MEMKRTSLHSITQAEQTVGMQQLWFHFLKVSILGTLQVLSVLKLLLHHFANVSLNSIVCPQILPNLVDIRGFLYCVESSSVKSSLYSVTVLAFQLADQLSQELLPSTVRTSRLCYGTSLRFNLLKFFRDMD